MSSQKASRSTEATPRLFYGYIIAVAGLIIMTTMLSTRYAFGVFFKPVQTDLNWTRAMTSGAFSLSLFTEGLLGIVMGGLNDRIGPRKVLTFSGFLLGLGCLLMSQIRTIWQLYLFLGIIMGIGISGGWIPITSTVARWFIKRRGLMSGFVLSGTGLAGLIAPPVAGFLILTYGWRYSFTIMGTAILLITLFAAQFLRRDPSQMGQVPYGAEVEREKGPEPGAEGLSLREALLTRHFWLVNSMVFCFGFCMFTVVVHIVPHATDLGIAPAAAVKILAAMGGISMIGRLFLGNLADRIGSSRIFIIGFILMPAAFLWLVPSKEMWMFYLFALPFGLAQGGMGAAESPLVAEIFGLKSHGLIYGAVGFSFATGAALGPWLAGYIYDVRNSYQLAFVLCAVIGIIGLILTTLLTQMRGDRTKL